MNIECMTDQVEIMSGCVQNIEIYKLGSQDFFDSVSTLSINYLKEKKYVPEEDLDIVHNYFRNLKSVNLKNIYNFSLAKIIKIVRTCKINNVSFNL